MIAVDPSGLHSRQMTDDIAQSILGGILREKDENGRALRYPGLRLFETRKKNLEKGIPVIDSVWSRVLSLLD